MNILWQLFITFFKIGAFTFGGGYAMIPLMQCEVCENKCWVNEDEIVDILVLAQSVPGAVAVNASTLIGHRIAGFKGALAATLGVVLPSFIIILALSGFLLKYGDSHLLEKAFYGIRAVVVALILAAVFKLRRSCICDYRTLALALISFITLLVFAMHPITAIIAGGIAGVTLYFLFIIRSDEEEGGSA